MLLNDLNWEGIRGQIFKLFQDNDVPKPDAEKMLSQCLKVLMEFIHRNLFILLSICLLNA